MSRQRAAAPTRRTVTFRVKPPPRLPGLLPGPAGPLQHLRVGPHAPPRNSPGHLGWEVLQPSQALRCSLGSRSPALDSGYRTRRGTAALTRRSRLAPPRPPGPPPKPGVHMDAQEPGDLGRALQGAVSRGPAPPSSLSRPPGVGWGPADRRCAPAHPPAGEARGGLTGKHRCRTQ